LLIFARRFPSHLTVFVVALLLLLPALFVLSPGSAVPQTQNSSAPIPTSAKASAFSSYKSAGPLDPSTPVLVSVAIPLRNLPLLSSMVEQLSSPSSSSFRDFLSYSQASQLFLPTEAQYQSVLDYLTASGFTVQYTALNSMIVVQGTAAQVTQSLGQTVDLFTNGTYSYYQTTGPSSLSGAFSYASNSTGLLMHPDYVKASAAGSSPIAAGNVTFTEGGQPTKFLQTVYNSTGLIAKGDNGKGYTVGLLDFYGYNGVASDLALYDKTYGVPAPPSFNVSAIGPYNPNLGSATTWDAEIDLDVQASHAMAPGANIVLYAANGALSLAAAVAGVIQDGRANVVSQSFGLPEWEYYEAGAVPYLFNSVFTDDYYMLGSAMGMTFLTSSGDAGGSGYSIGPEGGVQYPASSPYVTTLGGTATYITTGPNGVESFNQTAWSNIGFVPYLVNQGGSGGGVSIMEPTPWYQSSLPIPPTFPAGRLTPDLSTDGSGQPGTFVIYRGASQSEGGTSESSPLFAGLLTLLMGSQKGSLGLINPAIYQLAENAKTYNAAFDPITFGYTIPWTTKAGYNLVTGWGAPNIGEIASLYGSLSKSAPGLVVNVDLVNPGKTNVTDFTPGQSINVAATVATSTGLGVTTGTFTASLQTLGGTSPPVALAYSAAQRAWTGAITVGNQSGVAYVDVSGTSAGASGQAFASTFVGYLANFVQPLSPYPWTYLTGLTTAIAITDLSGKPSPFPTTPISFQSYSILKNTYAQDGTAVLNYSSASGYYIGMVTANLTDGPTTLVTKGPVVGYLPFMSGIGLEGTDIYPQVVAEPGSVGPGQSLAIVATVTAPENIYLVTSQSTGTTLGATIAEGANVTATLVSPSGAEVASAPLLERTCAEALRVCGASLTLINGYLTVPANATSGLYTILLTAGYNDETTGFQYGGSYFGQVYVAAGTSVPKITVSPSTLFEGENLTFTASITYPSGKEVTKGLYTALVYPTNGEFSYSLLMHETYAASGLTQLHFDPSLDLWVGNTTLPSPSNGGGGVAGVDSAAEFFGGPYEIFVTGVSADGVPTTASLSAQQDFVVQPYVFTTGPVSAELPLPSRIAFANASISAGSTRLMLSNDYFIGDNNVTGNAVTIASSLINGDLNVQGGQTTLQGVTGGNVYATNANVVLQGSSVSSLHLGSGATASIDASSTFGALTPALPVVQISSPVSNSSYTGSFNAQVSVDGSSVSVLNFILDGKQLPSLLEGAAPGSQESYPINTTALPDGTHTLTVVAVQSDLLTSSATVSFTTHNQLAAVNAALTSEKASAASSIASLNGSLASAQGSINTLQGNLATANHTISDLTELIYAAIGVALVAVVLAVYAIRGGNAPWKY